MTWLIRLTAVVTVLFSASVTSIAGAPDACACSCRTYETPQEAVQAFDAVFKGVPTSKKTKDRRVVYQVDVSLVYKGDVGAQTTIATHTETTACGTSFTLRDEGLFFVHETDPGSDAQFWATSCGPMTKSRTDLTVVLRQLYGEPRVVASATPTAAPDESDGSNRTVAYVVAGVAVAAVLGAVLVGAMLALSRRQRP